MYWIKDLRKGNKSWFLPPIYTPQFHNFFQRLKWLRVQKKICQFAAYISKHDGVSRFLFSFFLFMHLSLSIYNAIRTELGLNTETGLHCPKSGTMLTMSYVENHV